MTRAIAVMKILRIRFLPRMMPVPAGALSVADIVVAIILPVRAYRDKRAGGSRCRMVHGFRIGRGRQVHRQSTREARYFSSTMRTRNVPMLADLHFEHVAGFHPYRRVAPLADAFGRAGGDDVAGVQLGEVGAE